MNNENNFQNQTSTNDGINQTSNVNQVPLQSETVVTNAVMPVQEGTGTIYQNEVQVGNDQPINVTSPVSEVIDTNNASPVEEIVIPMGNTEQVVIDTVKKRGSNNFVLIFVVLLMVAAIVYIDEIILFVEENIIVTNPSDISDSNGDNLISGFIMIDDSTSSTKVNSIKFYNFKKNSEKLSIGLNFESDVEYKNVSQENIYIEIYNSNKEVLYKKLFDVSEVVSKNVVKTYSFTLDSDIYSDAYYALVKTYTEEELSKSSTLSCKYEVTNNDYNALYRHVFTFKNDMLVSYSVDKKVNISLSNNNSLDTLNKLKLENDTLVSANIGSTYSEGVLTYSIDLENLTTDYIPLYSKGTTSVIVKNKELFKKWECE